MIADLLCHHLWNWEGILLWACLCARLIHNFKISEWCMLGFLNFIYMFLILVKMGLIMKNITSKITRDHLKS